MNCCSQPPVIETKQDIADDVVDDKVKLHDDSHITQDDFLLLDEDSDMDDVLMNVITAGQDERDDVVQLSHVETEHSVVLQTCDVPGVEEALNKAIHKNVLAIPQSLLNVQINNLTAGQDERDDVVQLSHVETEHSVVLQTCDVPGVEEELNKAIYKKVLAIPQSLLNVQINNLISNDYRENLTTFCHEITDKFNSCLQATFLKKMSNIATLPLYTGHSLCTLAHQITKILSVHIEKMNTQHYRSAYIIVDHLREQTLHRRVAAVKLQRNRLLPQEGHFCNQPCHDTLYWWMGNSNINLQEQTGTETTVAVYNSKKRRNPITSIHQQILYLDLLIEDEQYLMENNADKPSVSVTNNKQYVRRGLGYASDKASNSSYT